VSRDWPVHFTPKTDISRCVPKVHFVPLSDSCTAAKAPCGITSSARARNARVEELAPIIASNALIAMRDEVNEIARNKLDEAAAHRESLHDDKVRECGAALAEKRPRRF
jgi:hypothetical protein